MVDDDLALLDRWAAGDESAGNALVRRYFSPLYRFFAPRVGADAAELIQGTLTGLVEAHDRFSREVGLRAFLFGIARNTLMMHLRTRYRAGRVFDPVTDPVAIDQATSPSGRVAAAQEQRLLLRALRRLPLETQLLLELFYWEQLSIQELATVLEAKPGAIKVRLHRARKTLRDLILELAESPVTGQSTVTSLDAWAASVAKVVDSTGPG